MCKASVDRILYPAIGPGCIEKEVVVSIENSISTIDDLYGVFLEIIRPGAGAGFGEWLAAVAEEAKAIGVDTGGVDPQRI